MHVKILACCLLITIAAKAQQGNYFLTHFTPDNDNFSNACFDLAQDQRGIFYFATQGGVLQFDGRNWDVIQTPGAVYAIEVVGGKLFVAGSKGFGKIDTNLMGLPEYQPIYEVEDTRNIFQMRSVNDKVYFLNDRNLFIYSPVTNEVKLEVSSKEEDWIGLHEIFGNAFVSSEDRGIFTLGNNSLIPARLFQDLTSLVFAERQQNEYLLGTSDSRLFLLREDMRLKEVKAVDSTYLSTSVMINAAWVNKDLVALGTLRGGIVFINPNTGETEEIINYNTGLPDNEVYTLIKDRNQNIWASHTYGFTRIAPYMPFRSFRYYAGLQGNLLCASQHNNGVYVGTSLGLYKLVKEEFYDEITYFVDVPVKTTKKTTQVVDQQQQSVPVEPKPESQKGGLFGFLKKKKREVAETEAPQRPLTETKEVTTTVTTYKQEKRTKKILRSSHFAYKRVEGIDAKVTQLVQWKGKLLAAGLSGVNEITPGGIVPVMEYPTRFLFASESTGKLLISTYDDKLHEMVFDKTGWKEERLISNVDDPITFIFEEPGKAFWLSGLDKVFRVNHDATKPVMSLTVTNSRFERLIGTNYNNHVIFSSSSGFFAYDFQDQSLKPVDSLPRPKVAFAEGERLWFRDDHGWFALNNKGSNDNIELFNLFSEIRFITADEQTGYLWIITGNNELFRFNPQKLLPTEFSYPLFLRSIEQENTLVPLGKLKMDQENSSLRIEVVKPDYIGARSVEYRYYLEGLHTQWSEWAINNNIIDIPYLPNGKYMLLVQARDIFGRVTTMEPLSMDVLPPYWQRSWFYALEFLVFASLVVLSFRLSNRFRFVSRVLSLLSIIILIEFIQTAAGSTFETGSSPVIEFLVQVGIAFLILPVESFLRRFMLRSIDKNSQYTVKEPVQDQAINTLEK
ncbi:MAG TPA: triple tyrosine motif-containing protein [Cyclobacteriaceae bacterium]|nr:triple tyrosine motif-containing protein [Cyclobacteriaceae bacterium]HRJ80412.1 triple tyrosine motif-containing protein [Cyclobacteriaceae bacterium]